MKAVHELFITLMLAVSKVYATSLQHFALQEPVRAFTTTLLSALYPKCIAMCYTFQLAVGNVELCK